MHIAPEVVSLKPGALASAPGRPHGTQNLRQQKARVRSVLSCALPVGWLAGWLVPNGVHQQNKHFNNISRTGDTSDSEPGSHPLNPASNPHREVSILLKTQLERVAPSISSSEFIGTLAREIASFPRLHIETTARAADMSERRGTRVEITH